MYSKLDIQKWFRKIDGKELVFGKKYLIDEIIIGKYVFYLRFGTEYYRWFELTPYYSQEYSDDHTFYEWIFQNTKEKMERILVNKVLRKILNDPYFIW
jgi:hypothetical protein